MTAYDRGDVVLVSFVLSDESGKKLRPAVDRADAGDEGDEVGERHEATVRILDERIQRLTAIRALVD